MSEAAWRTNVTEVVATFKGALQCMVPYLRQARIPTGIQPGADGWDDITETLFKHIVAEAIRWSLPQDEMDGFKLPEYETAYESYAVFSAVIEVVTSETRHREEGQRLVFHSFKAPSDDTNDDALDTVLACPVRGDWTRCAEQPIEIPFDLCELQCLLLLGNNKVRILTALEVAL